MSDEFSKENVLDVASKEIGQIPFFPWGQIKYFEKLNDFAEFYVDKVNEVRGTSLENIQVKPFLDETKDDYWSILMKRAKYLDGTTFSSLGKNLCFGWGFDVARVFYPFISVINHFLNHTSSNVEFTGEGIIYVPTGLTARVNSNFNSYDVCRDIAYTIERLAARE